MNTRFQDRLIHEALARGYLNVDGVRAALRGLAERRALGRRPSLDRLLVEMGLLTPDQAAVLRRIAGREATQRLGDLEILDRIGGGALGTVYRARQRRLDRVVAVKVLAGHLAHDLTFVRRFVREARLTARIVHPNVVRVFDVGQAGGRPFIVMEYVPGPSLEEIIHSGGRLTERRVLSIALQMGRALQAAAAHGLVHGDVKPANILIRPDGLAKLADLGLATMPGEEGMRGAGTPLYMSPEQARGQRPDGRSDIYSLGCTLFHALTGRVPFPGSNAAETLRMHAESPPPSAVALRPDLSPEVDALVRRMMAKRPVERFARPAEFLRVVERLIPVRAAAGREESP